jgi:folylpolyglutamate synthase/dihydrofolate synthase
MNLGLDRIQTLLAQLDHPEKQLGKVIHVAGTNGKGSVCAYISTCLAYAGYKVGRFTSPFLIEPRDSISILNRDRLLSTPHNTITPFALDPQIYTTLRARITLLGQKMLPGQQPTEFEILTAIAFQAFAEEGVDVSVIEVGLGGLRDATNVFHRPTMTIVTCIGYDHQALLGETLEAIAIEKAGIIKTLCPTVIARQPYLEVEHTLMRYVTKRVILLPTSLSKDAIILPDQSEIRPPLNGTFQVDNLNAALSALIYLTNCEKSSDALVLSLEDFHKAMQYCYWPGRLSLYRLYNDRLTIIVDGAHNIDGISALRTYLDHLNSLEDGKPYDVMIQNLVKPGDIITLTTFTTPLTMDWIRSVSTTHMHALIHKHYGNTVTVYEIDHAINAFSKFFSSMVMVHTEKKRVVVCGSLYLVADFYRYFETHREDFSGEDDNPSFNRTMNFME